MTRILRITRFSSWLLMVVVFASFALAQRQTPAVQLAPPTNGQVNEETLVKGPDAKRLIVARFPKDLNEKDKAKLSNIIDRSLAAIRAGRSAETTSTIKEFQTVARISLGNMWFDCGEHCNHHLDAGDHVKYGVCYWACIANGGPDKTKSLQ
jgi:hypothetical protein